MSAADISFGDKQTGSPFYGRWWKLIVKTAPQNGSVTILTADSSSDLRVVFDIKTERIKDAFWYGDISVYNLNQETTTKLLRAQDSDPHVDPAQIQPGAVVTFEAGYKNGAQGVIWEGPLFQQLWERENVTDFKLTLHCALGLLVYSNENAIAHDFGALTAQTEVVAKIAAAAFREIPVATIAPLSNMQLPRGQTFFGNPASYFNDIADENGMEWFMSMHGLEMSRGDEDIDLNATPELIFASPDPDTMKLNGDNYIIGTPQQTEDGVSFITLLEPRLHVTPPQRVKIDNSSIQLLRRQIGDGLSNLMILDQDGYYFVQAIRHFGDTRGAPWYSEVTGVTTAYFSQIGRFLGN